MCARHGGGGDKNLFARKGGASQKKIGKHCSWAWNGYVQPREPHATQSKVPLLCMYNIMKTCPYFYKFKVDVFDAVLPSATYHVCVAYRQIFMCPLMCKTHFYPFCSSCTKLSSIVWFHWHLKLA